MRGKRKKVGTKEDWKAGRQVSGYIDKQTRREVGRQAGTKIDR